MIVREARAEDAGAVRRIIDAAFGQPAEGNLVEALRSHGDARIELVAESDGRLVGHVLLSRLESPAGALALAPLAVLPERQREGVGAALTNAAIDRARRGGAPAIFLLGEPAYYERFGFSVAAAAPFETAYPKDYMMALALAPGALDALAGPIIYAPAFDALG